MTQGVFTCGVVDCGELSRVHNLCFSAQWTSYEFANLLSMPGVFARLIRDADGPGCDYGGFVLGRIAGEEGEIISIGVVTNCRGQGLGTELVSAVVAQCRRVGVLELMLEVAETNFLAVRLYKSFGFKIVGRRIGYYVDRVNTRTDALIMRRYLR